MLSLQSNSSYKEDIFIILSSPKCIFASLVFASTDSLGGWSWVCVLSTRRKELAFSLRSWGTCHGTHTTYSLSSSARKLWQESGLFSTHRRLNNTLSILSICSDDILGSLRGVILFWGVFGTNNNFTYGRNVDQKKPRLFSCSETESTVAFVRNLVMWLLRRGRDEVRRY